MFCDGHQTKKVLNGVTYGPFAPGADGPWPEASQMVADMRHVRSLGFDVVRVYEPPNDGLLEACRREELGLLVGMAWTQHVDFLQDEAVAREAEAQVRRVARRFANEPSVMGFIVGNEIEKTLVRWMGPDAVRDFLEGLVAAVQREAPCKPVSYASYPSTEYLMPRNADFVAFNVFLEEREKLAAYLQHLQNLAAGRPLVITEFGIDTKHHGEAFQAQARQWLEEEAWRAGVAGRFWFSFTDAWHRGGEEVTGWEFGLVTRQRREKLACAPPVMEVAPGRSRISVVVCTRNGASTLKECLEALRMQRHAPHEVLIIDDGSTDGVPEIARQFPEFVYHRQDHAGLSVARNLGMKMATGDVIAYTDDDCFPDEDWVWHLSLAFEDGDWIGAGGPNLSPPPRTVTEACVAAAPGAPSHVLVNDVEAEHLPGCNLAIRKSALEAIGGFRDEFTTAGDDVDVCWRLQEAGGRMRFVPAAVVWHHRRFTVRAYLRQQAGYGRAEAMLIKRFPQRFAWFGGARWRGAIYGDGAGDLGRLDRQRIHFGRYGSAPFQCVYAGWETGFWSWWRGLPWLALVLGSGLAGSSLLVGGFLALGLVAAQRRACRFDEALKRPTRWQQGLLWFLCLAQPVVRDWARLRMMVKLSAWPKGKGSWPVLLRQLRQPGPRVVRDMHWQWWNAEGKGREELLAQLVHSADSWGLSVTATGDDSFWDLQVLVEGRRCWLTTVTEYHEHQQRLTRVALRRPLWSGSMEARIGAWMNQAAVSCGLDPADGAAPGQAEESRLAVAS
jgi:GT2 family glycosyltransferase/exo-beta-1,3-glucanase (GH17 family)